jgi:hypothetical protein
MFWRNDKKLLDSSEYEKLSKKIIELSADIANIKIEFKILETNYNNLRGQFNRKLAGIRRADLQQDEGLEEQPKDINNPVILPYDGTFRQYR